MFESEYGSILVWNDVGTFWNKRSFL